MTHAAAMIPIPPVANVKIASETQLMIAAAVYRPRVAGSAGTVEAPGTCVAAGYFVGAGTGVGSADSTGAAGVCCDSGLGDVFDM